MRVRVVVADQSEAKFYDLRYRPDALQLVGRILDPLARLHDRDFKSDRPGRVFDHAPMTGHRRGATAHHATAGERRPRRHEAEAFARQIAGELQRGHGTCPASLSLPPDTATPGDRRCGTRSARASATTARTLLNPATRCDLCPDSPATYHLGHMS